MAKHSIYHTYDNKRLPQCWTDGTITPFWYWY